MKTLFKLFIALLFPWLTFLFTDRPGAALIALLLQVSVIGWLPASIWAMTTVMDDNKSSDSAKDDDEEEDE